MRFQTCENKSRYFWMNYEILIPIYIYMQGRSSPIGWGTYNKSFSIIHKFNGRGSRHFWQSNWFVVPVANHWTLLQDTVCPILQAVSSVPSCKLIEETCERKFSMHFDYCTTASIDFVMLDEATFSSILKVGSYFQSWLWQWDVVHQYLGSHFPKYFVL